MASLALNRAIINIRIALNELQELHDSGEDASRCKLGAGCSCVGPIQAELRKAELKTAADQMGMTLSPWTTRVREWPGYKNAIYHDVYVYCGEHQLNWMLVQKTPHTQSQ